MKIFVVHFLDKGYSDTGHNTFYDSMIDSLYANKNDADMRKKFLKEQAGILTKITEMEIK